MARPHDHRIAALARTQHGIVSAGQLRALGVDRSAIRRRVAAGSISVVLPGIYVVGPVACAPASPALMFAGVLSCAAPAAVALETAAARHGIWPRAGAQLHVMAAAARRPVAGLGITFHSSASLRWEDVALLDGVPTTTVVRTCFDLGRVLTPHQLAHVLHEAAFRSILDRDALSRLVAEHRRAPGTGVVRRALELHEAGSTGTRSRTEDHLLEGILAARLPEPVVNTRGAANVPGIECDLVWRRRRLVVEVDGPGHDLPGARAQDALRDEVLGRAGWRVLRYPPADVWSQRRRVVGQIARALDS